MPRVVRAVASGAAKQQQKKRGSVVVEKVKFEKKEVLEDIEYSDSEEEQEEPYKRHALSRKPPSRRLYVDLSQQALYQEYGHKTAANVNFHYRRGELPEMSHSRKKKPPEDDLWLQQREGGKYWIHLKKGEEAVVDEDEVIEKIEVKFQDEVSSFNKQEVTSSEVKWRDLHDYRDVRASNYMGRVRKPEEQTFVMPVYARYGQSNYAFKNFEPGGLMEEAAAASLGRAKSEVNLPKFSDRGTAAERFALTRMLTMPDRRTLLNTTM